MIKKTFTTGFDFDGVVSEGIRPIEGISCIVTGRPKEANQEIEACLLSMGIKVPIYNFSGEADDKEMTEAIGQFKAQMVKELGIKVFYEDTPRQVEIIQEANPGVQVILVPRKEVKKKFIFLSYEGYSAPIAYKLLKEGSEVTFAMIEDKADTLLSDEDGDDEDLELKDRRLSIYKGILPMVSAKKVLAVAKKLNPAEYFVMTDINNSFKYTSKLLDMGFDGFFPLEEDRKLEVDRQAGKDIVKKYYTGIEMQDTQEFKSVEDGIRFLEETENLYVLKSLGDSGETVVPKTDDVEAGNRQVIDALNREKQAYEQNGFLLEQKIINAVEFTPEICFWNGEPLYTTVDIETKTKSAGEKGGNVGCGTNLIIRTKLTDRINQIAFPPFVYEMAKKRKGLFFWDMGILADGSTGKLYFTEFCPNRAGWDSFPTEVAMSAEDKDRVVSPFFEKAVRGENPILYKYGFAVRVFNDNVDDKRYPAGDMNINVAEEVEPYVYLYDAKAGKEGLVTVGYQQDLGTVTGVSNSIDNAIEKAYEAVENIFFKDLNYRFKDDAFSTSYPQAIMRRYNYLVYNKFIEPEDAED